MEFLQVVPVHAQPPLVEVFTSREVVAGLVALVVGLLSLGNLVLRWSRSWIQSRIDALHDQVVRVGDRAEGAKEAATRAVEATTNSHGTHIRDDMDEIREDVRTIQRTLTTVLDRMDVAESNRIEERNERERRDQRAEDQIDGLRDDIRAITANSDRTHARLDERIAALETHRLAQSAG